MTSSEVTVRPGGDWVNVGLVDIRAELADTVGTYRMRPSALGNALVADLVRDEVARQLAATATRMCDARHT